METSVHIVHPYTFKMTDVKSATLGLEPRFAQRDKKIKGLVEKALEKNQRVYHHRDSHPDTLQGGLRDTLLSFGEEFQFLSDRRIIKVITTNYGIPLMDERPKEIGAKDWKKFLYLFTTHSKMKELIGKPDNVLVIGGVLENCVTNMLDYYASYYRENGEHIRYIPELCVSFDKTEAERCTEELAKKCIRSISYEEALSLIE